MKHPHPLLLLSVFAATLYGLGVTGSDVPLYNMMAKGLGVSLLALFAFWNKHGLLALALAFGALGDMMLASPVEDAFIYGLSAFLIGHIFYMTILWPRRTGALCPLRKALVLFTLVLSAGTSWHLVPQLGPMLASVLFYMAILVAMTLMAQASRTSLLVALGAFLFFVSDVILGLYLFSADVDMPRWVNWWFYYPAQLLLCLGLMKRGNAHEN